MKSGNLTNSTAIGSNRVSAAHVNHLSHRRGIHLQSVSTPPNKLFREYLRCRQLNSLNGLRCKQLSRRWDVHSLLIFAAPNACPFEYEDDIRVCWKATMNGSIATSVIEYDHGQNYFYDGVRYGIENCSCDGSEASAMIASISSRYAGAHVLEQWIVGHDRLSGHSM